MHKEYQKLIEYGLRIIAKKRYTVKEMEKKLWNYVKKKEELNGESIPEVIDRLIELNYLDDKKFAEDYISSRSKLKPRGKLLLNRELRAKGLDKELVIKALQNTEIDEKEAAEELLKRRMQRWTKNSPMEQKAKAYRFLYSKGFSQDDIYRAIESCYNQFVD